MALVDTTTGEIVDVCSADEARRLTDEIRGAAERVWSLLVEAHERRAWAALGYSSWREYATNEFGMSQSRAYQLLDQARVVLAIEEATGVDSTKVEITERDARDIKPRLKAVTDSIKEKLTEEAIAPEPERVKEIVAEVVAEERAKAQQRDEDRAALSDLREKAEQAGMDMDEDRMRQRGEFSRLCRDLSKLPDPDAIIDRHDQYLTPRHVAQAERAHAWLDGFLSTLKERA